MKNKNIFFGLRHKNTGEFCSFEANTSLSIGGREAGDVEHFLCKSDSYDSRIWTVNKKEIAENARVNNTELYNAEYMTPHHDSSFIPDDWEVVELEIKVKD